MDRSVEISGILQKKLMDNFPEIEKVVTKIGSAEVPTDPMPVETGDIMVIMKPKDEWVSASSRQEMFEKMEVVMNTLPGVNYEFSQPIQMRFNELMSGSRGDIAVKIYGEDLDLLYRKAKEAERIISQVDGVASINVEQIVGMPQIIIRYKYDRLAQYGIQVRDVNRIIRAAFAGEKVSTVFEGDRRFDMVVRFQENYRKDIKNIEELYIPLANGHQIPLEELADVKQEEAPMQISRDDTKRRVVLSVNAGARDTESLVGEIQERLDANLDLPAGYFTTYGGQFENLVKARNRLLIAVPVALLLIFILLFLTFNSISQALLIFTAIPLSAIGGIWALWFRHMPFSISAGIGFIALFGVAVLNGIVLIAYFNQLEKEGMTDIKMRILEGTRVRLRPVVMTAAVASLGFLPMALSNSGGAEVQRPLATVVIGGLITATLLTLIVLPILYSWLAKWKTSRLPKTVVTPLLIIGFMSISSLLSAQVQQISYEEALQLALENAPALKTSDLQIQQKELLLGSGFSPPKAQIFYNGDGLGRNGDFAEHSFGVQQRIHLPKVYRVQNDLHKANLQLTAETRNITALTIQQEVARIYSDWIALQEKTQLFYQFDRLYTRFLNIAQQRVLVGAANALEPLAIQNELEMLRIKQQQSFTLIQGQEKQLQYYLNTTKGLNAREDTLLRIPLKSLDSAIVDHPTLAYFRQLEQVGTAQQAAAKTQLLPDFTLGYATQIFSGIGGLNAVQIGLNIPLFRKGQRKRIEAAGLQGAIAREQFNSQQFQLQSQLNQLFIELQSLEQALQFYEQKGQQYSKELIRLASLNYQSGEITYLAFLQALEQTFELSFQYLDQLQQYNQVVIQINFIND